MINKECGVLSIRVGGMIYAHVRKDGSQFLFQSVDDASRAVSELYSSVLMESLTALSLMEFRIHRSIPRLGLCRPVRVYGGLYGSECRPAYAARRWHASGLKATPSLARGERHVRSVRKKMAA
jgi:hypothetical protein